MDNNTERPVDRIKLLARWYVSHKAIHSIREFEEVANLSTTYIKNLFITPKGNPGVDVVAKIYRTFKGVSLHWLILGEGDMFTVPEDEAIKNALEASRESRLMKTIKKVMDSNISKEELKAIIEKL